MRLRLHGFRRVCGIAKGQDAQRACRANLLAPSKRTRKVEGGKGAALMLRLLGVIRKMGGGW